MRTNLNAPQLIKNLLDNSIKSITNQTLISQVQLNNSAGSKPFSCHKCQRTFNSKYNVIRHLKQYHAEKRMFKCSICGRDYKWVDSLHKHMKMHKQQQMQLEEQKKQEEAVVQSQEMSESGVVILEENDEEQEPETELDTEINNDIEPDLGDDDSLIILSPKNNFESFM